MELQKLHESPNFEANGKLNKAGCDDRCVCCNKPLKSSEVRYFVHMTTDWLVTDANEDELKLAGYESQGCFPIGNECSKKVDKKFLIEL